MDMDFWLGVVCAVIYLLIGVPFGFVACTTTLEITMGEAEIGAIFVGLAVWLLWPLFFLVAVAVTVLRHLKHSKG